ncbi:hypothetical protein RDWZM_004009 [Blomia tropicalis]|uniref:DNA/RNA-binding protein Kin17 WH-like domain-containing protein n=1 Tax=Blomia tropicalis TaxID=40697 RepID=A0A9Q0MGN0_BLOTA|nr:hypothetical protein RDWZM_004009 [Blomia tropicalis]
MPKHEPMSAKAIGKKIKSKGLQKLKFFCQMCQKQCRDANGFKCHLTSEAHQRQLLLFSENPNKYMNDFSSEFLKDFLHLLKRRYSTKRVFANQVYQEYIKDRDHLHMNSTRWCTLTGLVKWMGRKGICHVDHTEKGWFITYIDRDPETLLRQENLAKKEKMAKDDEERQAKVIADMIKRGQKNSEDDNDLDDDKKSEEEEKKSMLIKESEDQKIVFSFAPKKTIEKSVTLKFSKPFTSSNNIKQEVKKEEMDGDHQEIEIKKESIDSKDNLKRKINSSKLEPPKKKTALDEIIEEQEKWKAKKLQQKKSKPETWLIPGIIVRVVVKDLGEQFYEKKAVIEKIVDDYGAIIKMNDSGQLIKVDERHLETVVPREGSRVMVLKGLYRGKNATIAEIDIEQEKCKILVDNSSMGGRTVTVTFNDISKLA